MNTWTPDELSLELRVDARKIRKWLRKQEWRDATEKGKHWHLTPEQADAVRQQFRN